MKPSLRFTAILLATVLASAPALAAERPDKPTGKDPLFERIDLATKDAEPADVFRMFARILEADLSFDPAITTKVSMTAHDVTVRTLLTAVCESIRCSWHLEHGKSPRLVVEKGGDAPVSQAADLSQLITVSLRDADAVRVFALFAQIGGLALRLDPEVTAEKRLVTVELKNIPASQALDQVCRLNGLRWRLDEGPPKTLAISAAR